MSATPHPRPLIVKRYARSRLYDAAAGRYRTVEELRQWATMDVPFVVVDTESGKDLTRVLLA